MGLGNERLWATVVRNVTFQYPQMGEGWAWGCGRMRHRDVGAHVKGGFSPRTGEKTSEVLQLQGTKLVW